MKVNGEPYWRHIMVGADIRLLAICRNFCESEVAQFYRDLTICPFGDKD